MQKFLMALVLVACFTKGAMRAEELTWETDYDKALALAKEKQKPVLLDFSASWCGPCRMMETATFSDVYVQNALGGFILVKVDFDHNPALVGKYRVDAIPACFILNQFGERVDLNVGFSGPQDFWRWLQKNFATAYSRVSRNQSVLDRLANVAATLTEPDAARRDAAAEDLLRTYCAKDADDNNEIGKHIEQIFRDLTQRQPSLALPYANDRRLAVRILFAGLLAEKIGADFQYDPWAKSAARAAAIETWQKKLAGAN